MRPLVNEWLFARWCILKAVLYCMFRWKTVWVHREYESGRVWLVVSGDKIFYERGKT